MENKIGERDLQRERSDSEKGKQLERRVSPGRYRRKEKDT